MIDIGPETVISVFAIFCRVGACLMIAPGFSAMQIPVRVRLYIALAASLALSPALLPLLRGNIDGSLASLLSLIFSELATGLLIGFVARVFFIALQAIGVAITQA
ncbi:MAG: flagellar biosynthetic protein FliR, partial [Bauldia sp.]|nr:flagellar biosynthetic protein FliR [Bauldia sp.]